MHLPFHKAESFFQFHFFNLVIIERFKNDFSEIEMFSFLSCNSEGDFAAWKELKTEFCRSKIEQKLGLWCSGYH